MRLSGERYVRLRVVLLSVPAAESRCCRSAIGRAPRRAPREVPDDELVDVAGRSRVFRTQCAPSTPPALPTVPQGGASLKVRLAHSPRSPESVHLVPNLVRTADDASSTILKARFLSVRKHGLSLAASSRFQNTPDTLIG